MAGNVIPASQTGLKPLSATELKQRRRQLRRRRGVKVVQAVWRTMVVSGLAGGLIWVCTLPIGVIEQPEQISVQGNKLLSADGIRSLLPLSYPQSLFRLEPQAATRQLTDNPAIAEAVVTRQLFPPQLVVQVQERQPVAIAHAASPIPTPGMAKASQVGLLDAEGVWIPLEIYESAAQSTEMPQLKVLGLRTSHRQYWAALYRTVTRSSIEVYEIDWREPTNLILKTSAGVVHLGPFVATKFPQQLAVLAQMQQLPAQTAKEVAYVDLSNPNAPLLQMRKTILNVKPNT